LLNEIGPQTCSDGGRSATQPVAPAGPTPFNYQSAVLDPTGRVISLNLRKIFY
jgi:hypothetical protein